MPATPAVQPNDPGHVLSVAEAAELLKLTPQTVYRAIQLEKFPSPVMRVGGRILVLRKPLMELLASGWTMPKLPEESKMTSARENNLAVIAAQEAREARAKGEGGAR